MSADTHPRTWNLAVSLAATVIIIAGLKSAGEIILPFMLGGFIAILCATPYNLLRSWRLPSWLCLVVMMAILIAIQGLFFTVIANTVADFSQDLPGYQKKFIAAMLAITTQANHYGIEVSPEFVRQHLDPSVGIAMMSGVLGKLGGLASKGFLILLLVLFAIMELGSLPAKMRTAFADDSIDRIQGFVATVRTYMGIKSISSAATALLVYVLLVTMQVEYAILWAVMAFMLNFIPSIGSILAAVPAILLTVVNGGLADAAIVTAGYLVINIVIGNLIEPRILGKGAGISPLAVIISLIFWGWVFGPVGMLLAVPLTVLIKIAFETSENTRWLAIMLGPEPVIEAKEAKMLPAD